MVMQVRDQYKYVTVQQDIVDLPSNIKSSGKKDAYSEVGGKVILTNGILQESIDNKFFSPGGAGIVQVRKDFVERPGFEINGAPPLLGFKLGTNPELDDVKVSVKKYFKDETIASNFINAHNQDFACMLIGLVRAGFGSFTDGMYQPPEDLMIDKGNTDAFLVKVDPVNGESVVHQNSFSIKSLDTGKEIGIIPGLTEAHFKIKESKDELGNPIFGYEFKQLETNNLYIKKLLDGHIFLSSELKRFCDPVYYQARKSLQEKLDGDSTFDSNLKDNFKIILKELDIAITNPNINNDQVKHIISLVAEINNLLINLHALMVNQKGSINFEIFEKTLREINEIINDPKLANDQRKIIKLQDYYAQFENYLSTRDILVATIKDQDNKYGKDLKNKAQDILNGIDEIAADKKIKSNYKSLANSLEVAKDSITSPIVNISRCLEEAKKYSNVNVKVASAFVGLAGLALTVGCGLLTAATLGLSSPITLPGMAAGVALTVAAGAIAVGTLSLLGSGVTAFGLFKPRKEENKLANEFKELHNTQLDYQLSQSAKPKA